MTMLEFVILTWGVALFLYVLFAGADFGAGILELFPLPIAAAKKSQAIGKAIGPVWEANHIWLILALVITFNAFPMLFWVLVDFYHFPMGFFVMGIIFRGASFTFMHYDPIYQEKVQRIYQGIFALSSLWCTFWMGVMVGSLMLGDFAFSDQEIWPRYFGHWLNPFALMCGVFMSVLMTFNASLFLYAESDTDKAAWWRVTRNIFLILVATGLVTHLIFYWQNSGRYLQFFTHPLALALICFSFLLLFPQYWAMERAWKNLSRAIAGLQLLCIMGAGFIPRFPRILIFRDGLALDIYEVATEAKVIRYLALALGFGLVCILPAYFYLLKIFKSEKTI